MALLNPPLVSAPPRSGIAALLARLPALRAASYSSPSPLYDSPLTRPIIDSGPPVLPVAGSLGLSGLMGLPVASGSPSAFMGLRSLSPLPATRPAPPAPGIPGSKAIPNQPRAPVARPTAPSYPSDAELQQQAAEYVANALKPLLDNAAAAMNARAAAGEQAIKGYSQALAQALSGGAGQIAGIYNTAQDQQRASDTALADALKGVGSTVGGPDAASRAAGSAGALQALGGANLGQLIANSAAAQANASAQPGIAGLTGLQSTRQLEAQSAQDLSNQLGQINAQAPGMIQSILGNLMDRRQTQMNADRTFNEGVREFNAGQAATAGERSASLATSAYNAGVITQRQLGQALGLPGWQKLPATVKPSAAPKTITVRPGDTVVDATTGRILASVPPTSSAAPAKPIILSPGQVAYLPNGQVIQGPAKPAPTAKPVTVAPGSTIVDPATGKPIYTAPEKPAAPQKPLVVGSASTGWNVVDPSTGKVIAKMNGAAPKPVVTGSAQTGWIARDPSSGKVLWQQAGAPAAAAKVVSSSLAPTSRYLVDSSGKRLAANPNYQGPKPPSAGDAKAGLAALAATPSSVDWQTGALSPTFRIALRNYAKSYGAGDPGPIPPVASKQELARLQTFLGITPPKTSARTASAPNLAGTGPNSRYEINPKTGKVVAPNPNYVPPTAKAASTKSQPSYADITKAKSDAADSAKDAYYGVPDNIVKVVQNGQVVAKNEPIPKRNYQEALKDLTGHGIPENIAVNALNRYYKPGERGRPATTSDLLRDKAIIWQRDGNGGIVAYRVFTDKSTGTQRRQALGTISPQDPNYKIARQRALGVAA